MSARLRTDRLDLESVTDDHLPLLVELNSDPQVMVPRMIGMRAEGALDLDPLVTTYEFADINTAVADVLAARVVKPVLVWPEG